MCDIHVSNITLFDLKENGSIFISVDALFGCVRKCNAGTSGKDSNHGEELFISQAKVDTFLASYNKKSNTKSMVRLEATYKTLVLKNISSSWNKFFYQSLVNTSL